MSQAIETSDRFNLGRFTLAQQRVYETVCTELIRGRKQMRWIWFIFPQVDGLGHGPTAKQYAIKSRDEAVAYLATPLLGARLIECTKLVLAVPNKSAHEIFGSPDDIKFRSSMTLFDAVDGGKIYRKALEH